MCIFPDAVTLQEFFLNASFLFEPLSESKLSWFATSVIACTEKPNHSIRTKIGAFREKGEEGGEGGGGVGLF